MTGQLRRVRVVGTTGLRARPRSPAGWPRALGVPHLELDEVFWDAGWTKRDPDEARALIRAFVASADRRLGDRRQLDRRDRAGSSTTPTRSSGSTTRAGR